MSETIRVAEITLEIEAQGSYEKAEKLARKTLELLGLQLSCDNSPLLIHPLKEGSTTMQVVISNLEVSSES